MALKQRSLSLNSLTASECTCINCLLWCVCDHFTNLTTLDCVPMISLSRSSRCWWLRSPVSLFSLSRATQNWAPISSSSLVPIWRPWRHHDIKENFNMFARTELSHTKTSQTHKKLHVQCVHTFDMQLNSKNIFKGLTEIYFKMAAVGFFLIVALVPGDGAVVHLQTPQFSMLESTCWGNFSCRNMIIYFICRRHTFKCICTRTCNPNKVFTAPHNHTSKWTLTHTHSLPPTQMKNFHVPFPPEQRRAGLGTSKLGLATEICSPNSVDISSCTSGQTPKVSQLCKLRRVHVTV